MKRATIITLHAFATRACFFTIHVAVSARLEEIAVIPRVVLLLHEPFNRLRVPMLPLQQEKVTVRKNPSPFWYSHVVSLCWLLRLCLDGQLSLSHQDLCNMSRHHPTSSLQLRSSDIVSGASVSSIDPSTIRVLFGGLAKICSMILGSRLSCV